MKIKKKFLICIYSIFFIGLAFGQDSREISVSEALSLERIKKIQSGEINLGITAGTGGPPAKLPDGSWITRDRLYAAMKPVIKQGRKVLPHLLKELQSEEHYRRFAGVIALESITKNRSIPYFYNASPVDNKNVIAAMQWGKYVEDILYNYEQKSWKEELHSKMIINPNHILHLGNDVVFKEHPELSNKEKYWVDECNKKEFFINKIKKIIELTNLQVPFYMSPEAGSTIIYYSKKTSDPNMANFNCSIFELFQNYSQKYGLLFYLADSGVMVLSIKESEEKKNEMALQSISFSDL